MKYIGVNIGALTVKLSALNGAEARSIVVPHQGRPAAVLKELLAEVDFAAADILHTLHDSMASKVIALLEKGRSELRRVLLIGGVSRNPAMVAALRGQPAAPP